MQKTLTLLCNERSTYEVHIETRDPPDKFVGGQSLDLNRLKTELYQHGCSDDMITRAIHDIEAHGSAKVML